MLDVDHPYQSFETQVNLVAKKPLHSGTYKSSLVAPNFPTFFFFMKKYDLGLQEFDVNS